MFYVAAKALTANTAQVAEFLVLLTMIWMWVLYWQVHLDEPFDAVHFAAAAIFTFSAATSFSVVLATIPAADDAGVLH